MVVCWHALKNEFFFTNAKQISEIRLNNYLAVFWLFSGVCIIILCVIRERPKNVSVPGLGGGTG